MSRDIVFKEPSAEESDDDTARPMQSQGEKQASIEEIQDTPAQNQRPTTPPPVTGITPSAVTRSPLPIDEDKDPATETEAEPTEPKRSSCLATKPKIDYAKVNTGHIQVWKESRKKPMENFVLLGTMSSEDTESDPETIKEALARPEADEWRKAIDDELKQHQDSGTFRLEHLLPGRRTIGWRMVFQTKRDENGNVSKCKARLIA